MGEALNKQVDKMIQPVDVSQCLSLAVLVLPEGHRKTSHDIRDGGCAKTQVHGCILKTDQHPSKKEIFIWPATETRNVFII
jgi:hypothetical protein